MKTTLNLDEALLEQAKTATGIHEKTALLHEGLRALLEKKARETLLSAKGSSLKSEKIPPRRKFS